MQFFSTTCSKSTNIKLHQIWFSHTWCKLIKSTNLMQLGPACIKHAKSLHQAYKINYIVYRAKNAEVAAGLLQAYLQLSSRYYMVRLYRLYCLDDSNPAPCYEQPNYNFGDVSTTCRLDASCFKVQLAACKSVNIKVHQDLKINEGNRLVWLDARSLIENLHQVDKIHNLHQVWRFWLCWIV